MDIRRFLYISTGMIVRIPENTKIMEAETQSMFGSVDDLIAMGYSGNLEFERDFLGEGLDMINNF